MTYLESFIDESFKLYPTLYGNSRLKVLNQMFVTNGNAMEWTSEGRLEMDRATHPEKPVRATLKEEAMAYMRTLPEASQRRVRHHYGQHEMCWDFPKEHADHGEAWQKWRHDQIMSRVAEMEDAEGRAFRDAVSYAVSYADELAKPPSFAELYLRSYGAIAEIPTNVQKDHLAEIKYVLTEILRQPQVFGPYSPRQNHVNAIIHLLNLRPLFALHGMEMEEEEILGIREASDERRLLLDQKRHVGNHELDESRWSDEEFFEYNRLSADGLAPDEVTLVRRYCQYRLWDKDQDDVRKEEAIRRQYENRCALFAAAKLEGTTLTAELPEATANWLKAEIGSFEIINKLKEASGA